MHSVEANETVSVPLCHINGATCNGTEECGEVHGTYGFLGTFFLAGILIFTMVTAFIGNGLICVVCYKKPKLLTIAHRYILHLAICQFIMTVVLMPLSLVSVFAKTWPETGSFFCHLEAFLKPLILTTMVLTLVLISCDRYVSITKPLHYQHSFMVTHWGLMVGLVWLISVAVAVPSIVGWNDVVYKPYQFSCVADHDCKHYGYVLYRIILGFIFPFALMGVVYIRIYVEAQKLMQRYKTTSAQGILSQSQKSSNEDSKKKKNEKWALNEWRVAKTGMTVVGAYLFCWIPFFIVLMGGGRGRPIWVTFASFMGFVICSINPYVYVFRSRSMRQQAKVIFMRMIGRDDYALDSDITPTGAFPTSRGSSIKKQGKSGSIYTKVPTQSQMSTVSEITTISEKPRIKDLTV